MRIEDIIDVRLSEYIAAKIWAKHAVSARDMTRAERDLYERK